MIFGASAFRSEILVEIDSFKTSNVTSEAKHV